MAGVLTVSPLADPLNYDIITIAGITTNVPGFGVVEVTGAERKYSWDVKKSAGSQGQTITYRGWELAKPKIKFKFWQDAQIRAFFDQIVPALSYDAEKQNPKPFDVYHPKLFASLIFWLVTDNIGDLVQEAGQLWTLTVETIEYRQAKAKNATSTPEQSNSSQGGEGTKPTVADKLRREIEATDNEFKRPLGAFQELPANRR